MNDRDIETFLMINEPTFEINGKCYSVCVVDGVYGTWDSDGLTFDFPDVSALLDNWMIDGKPFRNVVKNIM